MEEAIYVGHATSVRVESTFLHLHAQGIIACDFFMAVTASFRLLYVFVVIEHHGRRLIHCNATAHPNAAWTLQQLREAVGLEERCEYMLKDRDSIFAKHLEESIERLGVKVLKSPPRRLPKTNGGRAFATPPPVTTAPQTQLPTHP